MAVIELGAGDGGEYWLLDLLYNSNTGSAPGDGVDFRAGDGYVRLILGVVTRVADADEDAVGVVDLWLIVLGREGRDVVAPLEAVALTSKMIFPRLCLTPQLLHSKSYGGGPCLLYSFKGEC